MKRLPPLLLIAALAVPVASSAQNVEAEVLAVVERLFEGMRTGDSAVVRSTFHPEARMFSAGPQGIRPAAPDGFVRMVGTPHDSIWDEPIWDAEVRVDGHLATVWTKYAFYRGTQFSHCGVDSFQLWRSADGWKIVSLADTRQRENCETPPGRR